MRKPFIAGNWKMNKLITEATDYGELLLHELKKRQVDTDKVDLAIFAPFLHLSALKVLFLLRGIDTGAQNMHYLDQGAYTGEVSPSMLSDIGIERVIIGHSERRMYFGETNEACAAKIKAAVAHNIRPVLCLGESLDIREKGTHKEVVREMLYGSLENITGEEMKQTVVAYEPVWAIGTGKTASSDQAQEMAASIRTALADRFGSEIADSVIIQYGGSVKSDNIAELMSKADIDGALVGGASLKAEEFAAIAAFDESVLRTSVKPVTMRSDKK